MAMAAATAVSPLIDPQNPAHAGLEWLKNLESHLRSVDDAAAGGPGLGKFDGFRLALARRAGKMIGAGWAGAARGFVAWHEANRIAEVYSAAGGQAYEAFETFDEAKLRHQCALLGTDFDDAAWTNNRRAMFEHLAKEQKQEIDAELPFLPQRVVQPPPAPFIPAQFSHPNGMGPLAPAVGRSRTHYSMQARHAAGPTGLPPDTCAMVGVSLLRCCSVHSGTPHLSGWLGLTVAPKDVMVSALLGGCVPGIRPGGAIALEGVETVAPFRGLVFTQAECDAFVHVSNPDEAWALYDATQHEWFLLGVTPGVVLDDHNTWNGFAIGRDGRSLTSSPSAMLGAKANFSELQALLGVTSTTPMGEALQLRADGLAQASAEAAFNAAVSAKGAGHAANPAGVRVLTEIPRSLLDPKKNPVSGDPFPPLASAAEKLALVLQASQPLSTLLYDCDKFWWCLVCNAKLILEVCARKGLFSLDDIRNGRFRLTPEIKEVIVCLPPGQCKCSRHPLVKKKYHGMANPPCGVTILCGKKGCSKYIKTAADQITQACECGCAYDGRDTDEDVELDASKSQGVVVEVRARDELCYAYLTSVGGDKSLCAGGKRIVESVAQARLALNALRKDPTSLVGPHSRLRSPITGRKMAWWLLGRWCRTGENGVWLWDFLPEPVVSLPPLTNDQLNSVVKLAEKGGAGFQRPLSPALPKPSDKLGCAKYVDTLVTCLEIALEELVLFTSTSFHRDISLSVSLVKDEFQSQFRTHPPHVVFAAINNFMEDTSERLRMAATTPSVDHLTYYERLHGGVVRWLFNPSCASILRNVTSVNEARLEKLGWQDTESHFDLGVPAPASAPAGKNQQKGKKQPQPQKSDEAKLKEALKTVADVKKAVAASEEKNKVLERKLKAAEGKGGRGVQDGRSSKGGGRGGRASGPKGNAGRGGNSKGSGSRLPPPRPASSGAEVPASDEGAEEQAQGAGEEQEAYQAEDEEAEEYSEEVEDEDYDEGSGRALITPPVKAGAESSEKKVPLVPGEIHGDSIVVLLRKLRASHPKVAVADPDFSCEPCVQEVCPFFNSAKGCQQPGKCSRLHTRLPAESFSPAWHLWLLVQGGHWEVADSLTEEGICKLLSSDQVVRVMTIASPAARRDLLLRHLSNRLATLVHANSEPLDTLPVSSGSRAVHRALLWSSNAPFSVGSPSLMGPAEFSRVIAGGPYNGGCDSAWVGTAVNTGHAIGEYQNMCPIKAVASVMPKPHKAAAGELGLGPDQILFRDIIVSVLKYKWRQLYDKPQTDAGLRLASFAEALKNKGGFLLDQLWSVVAPECAKDLHILQICAGLPGKPVCYRLSLVHSNVCKNGELKIRPGSGHGSAKEQTARKFSARATSCPVVAVLVDRITPEAPRHSEGLLLGKGMNLAEVHKKLMFIADQGKNEVTYSERGAVVKLSARTYKSSVTAERVKAAHGIFLKVAKDLRIPQSEWEPEKEATSGGASLLRRSPLASAPDPQPEDELWDSLRPGFSAREESEENSETEEKLDLEALEAYKEQWITWHKERLKQLPRGRLTSAKAYAKFYLQHYVPMLKEEELEHKKVPHRALTFCSQFFNSWLLYQKHTGGSRAALEAIVAAVRKESFGDRASAGPDWQEVHEKIKGSLTPQHINLLKENISLGADLLFEDTLGGQGEWNESSPQDEKTTLKLLRDQLEEVTALRGLVFDYSDDRVSGILLEAGVRVSPIVTAVKLKPHGEPALDEEGDAKLRVCVHCSFGVNAPNATMRSAEHTRQKTTSPQDLIQKTLQEEQRYPNHPIQFVRDDLAAAFKQVAIRLKNVGLFATTALFFVLINLTLIFGAGPAPGDFEPLGDAILKTVLAQERPEESWAFTGAQHPEVGRFVDDLFSVIAITGNRCGDHLRRLREIVVAVMGEGGLNYDKQEEEGTPTTFKHAFGVVLDAVDRLVMAQWSKVVKLFNMSIDYVNGDVEGLTLKELQQLRGVTEHVLLACPGNGLARCVLPRIDAGLSAGGKKYPGGRTPPSSYFPDPSLKGEDEHTGHVMLRRALNLLLRLSVIERGKLLRKPFEMALPPEIRMTWPGKETSDAMVNMYMDASGESLYLIDLRTGNFIEVEFTEEEQELFNAWDLGDLAVTINHRELLSELFGGILLGPAHAGRLINLINDNTAAESWTNSDRHRDARVDQILSMLGLSETLLKQTFMGSRVKTDENFADFGTRKSKSKEYVEGLAALEKQYGWKARKVHVPPWLREMGWKLLKPGDHESDWYVQALSFVDWLETEHRGLIEKQSGVAPEKIREALAAAASGERIAEVPTPDGDFVDSTMSEARVWATHAIPLTPNQLQRSLAACQLRYGEEAGAKEFFLKHKLEAHQDPQEAIWSYLDAAYKEVFDVFSVENRKFEETATREQPPEPAPLSLPSQCRLSGKVKLSSAFTGLGSVDQGLVDTGLVELQSFCEQAPHLRKYTSERHPGAEAIPHLTCFFEKHRKRSAHLHDASAPCPAHATSNLYGIGNRDEFCGQYFEEHGKYVEHLEPVAAHMECNPGVLKAQRGRESPMAILEKNLPSYFVEYKIVDAGKTVSPATGRQAALCHERVHVFAWRRSCFDRKPRVQANKAKPLKEYADRLDNPEEGQLYYVMPVEDQKSVTFFTDVKPSKHAVRVGEIFMPEPGRGHHLFPNGVEDPYTGIASVSTAVSGSKWIPRVVNGRLVLTRLRNVEIARNYCADGRDNIDSELLEDGSFRGQHALGNMVPSNVGDWVAHLLMTECSRIQGCGQTAFERWAEETEQEQEPIYVSGGLKRGPVSISAEEDAEIEQLIQDVSRSGKKAKTYEQYETHFGQWEALAAFKGWPSSLDGLTPQEKCKRIIYWLAWDRKTHAVKASTLRTKLSAVRWKHISDWGPDPFEDTPGITDWLSNLKKLDGPAEFKLAVPISLLRMILCFLTSSFEHLSLGAALLTGFWFLLRSIEYLAEDDGVFDPNRSLTWGDITPRRAGHILVLCMIADADELSLTLYSSKNALETCTRTLKSVPGADTCVVAAIQALHAAFLREFGRAPQRDEAVFKKDKTQVYRRQDISRVLKVAAAAAGIPEGRIASHSLRRGGCSQYIAAGGQKEEAAIQRFGRWTSLAYKGYVMGASDALSQIQAAAADLVPRFERH